MQKALLIIAILSLSVIALWQIMYPSGTWRYKMTVEVVTPVGIKTGSAVREVKVQLGYGPASEMGPRITLKGGAVVVDLGDGRALFALLIGGASSSRSTDHGKHLLWDSFPASVPPLSKEGIKIYSNLKKEKATLEFEHYPMILLYDPYAEHKLIEIYDFKNPQPSAGLAIKRVTIEPTQEPVSNQKIISWFPKVLNSQGVASVYREGPLKLHPGSRLKKSFGLKENAFLAHGD